MTRKRARSPKSAMGGAITGSGAEPPAAGCEVVSRGACRGDFEINYRSIW